MAQAKIGRLDFFPMNQKIESVSIFFPINYSKLDVKVRQDRIRAPESPVKKILEDDVENSLCYLGFRLFRNDQLEGSADGGNCHSSALSQTCLRRLLPD